MMRKAALGAIIAVVAVAPLACRPAETPRGQQPITSGTARSADLKVGDVAPDFDLPASDGKRYKLADYAGKQAVVLAWFAKAFTAP